ncbi:MAG: hypothetical protein SW833_05155 [Cyanobacteriota bacterium]|nr:hypothetical protein [Cyanobacteriota bacterium]
MTATIVPKEADIVRLYKERSKSFEILVRSTEGVQVTPKNKSHVYSHKSATDEEGIDSIEISPVNPFSMKIVGRIRRNKSGGIFFDFGKFGCFSADGFGDFYIWGHWEPVDPHWSDALEDYTSGVDVTIQSSETKN